MAAPAGFEATPVKPKLILCPWSWLASSVGPISWISLAKPLKASEASSQVSEFTSGSGKVQAITAIGRLATNQMNGMR
jgi:hypothetical protein